MSPAVRAPLHLDRRIRSVGRTRDEGGGRTRRPDTLHEMRGHAHDGEEREGTEHDERDAKSTYVCGAATGNEVVMWTLLGGRMLGAARRPAMKTGWISHEFAMP